MAEELRSITIKVEIDTNKDTYTTTCSSWQEAREFIEIHTREM